MKTEFIKTPDERFVKSEMMGDGWEKNISPAVIKRIDLRVERKRSFARTRKPERERLFDKILREKSKLPKPPPKLKYDLTRASNHKNGDPKITTERPCMCCIKPFKSEGNHNRLCCQCRQISPD